MAIPKTKGFKGFVNRTINKVKKSFKTNAAKRQKNFVTKHKRIVERENLKQQSQAAKQATYRAKAKTRQAKTDYNATRSGPIGDRARKLQTKIAKSNAKVEEQGIKTKMFAKSSKTKIETDAAVKQTQAKGAAIATAASALGGSYSAGKIADKEAEKAKYEADKQASEALQDILSNTPNVTTDPYADKSVSGLVTGVR